jgi:hypothetical protein
MATPAATTKLAPKSGFFTWQFWVGLAAVLGTFILGETGIKVDLSFLNNLPDSVRNGIVPGVVIVGAVGLFIALSSWIETRTVKQDGVPATPNKSVPAKHKPFYQTSEFWLGLITVVLNYLHDSGVFAPDVRASTDTTTLLIALIYTFARSQLKQAYSQAQADGS